MKKKISIIIRTKNEERWISLCLQAVFNQKFRDFEVLLVDNQSSDKTTEKAKQFKVRQIITCKDYLPGKALNMGIRESSGEYIVCLSGHCIPVHDHWLSSLLENFDSPEVAGVYGRQEPMSFTSNLDKRDLALVFGLDRKVQIQDSFFHNANSMIRRNAWSTIPFDETITNIEDRVWAQKVLQSGSKIIYEPKASVYHYHGIHQDANMERCANVVRIMDSLNKDYNYKHIDVEKVNVVAIIPIKGEAKYIGKRPLLAYTIERALESKYIKKVIVSTDTPATAKLAEKYGAQSPFLRDPLFSKEYVDLNQVLQYSLNKLEEIKIFPDLVVPLEVTFPFRPASLLDSMIKRLAISGFDSIIAAYRENKAIWEEENGTIRLLKEGVTPREFKEPVFIELKGVGCVTHPEFIREGNLLGSKIGIYELNDPYSRLEVRSDEDCAMAAHLLKNRLA